MNEHEHNFDQLKLLLKLKRHEVPPPGYFDRFSSQVLSAIREERSDTAVARLNTEVPFFLRFLRIFDSRPGLLGGLATSMALLMVFGVVLADHPEADLATQTVFNPTASAQTGNGNAMFNSSMTPDLAADSSSGGGISVSTNPADSLQPNGALFGQQNPLFQNASFQVAGK